MKRIKRPRPLSLVRFDPLGFPDPSYPFGDDHCIFFGDIPNCSGHCVVMKVKTKEMFVGYHTDNFFELSEEET